MGQKVHPHGMRVGVIKNWSSKWYADSKDFAKFVVEDNKIRKELKKELYQARISDMIIERTNSEVRVTLHTAKPGLVIGKNGAQLEELKKKLQTTIANIISKYRKSFFTNSTNFFLSSTFNFKIKNISLYLPFASPIIKNINKKIIKNSKNKPDTTMNISIFESIITCNICVIVFNRKCIKIEYFIEYLHAT